MFHNLARPIIIAHRGASARAPENTMAAFELAAQAGARAIELDAQLSADDEVVVFHDITLDRCTEGHGRIGEKPYAAIAELDAGSWFSGEFRGQRIPRLEEVLGAYGRKLLCNVHLKTHPGSRPGLIRRVCDLIRRQALEERVFFSSFDPGELRRAARCSPEVPRCLLAPRGWIGAWARSFGFDFGDFEALHPHFTDVSVQQVRRVHRLGRRIHAWTVNAVADIEQLAAWGVDGILTDDPAMAVGALEAKA